MAFECIPLPGRAKKPRDTGLTMAIDRGLRPETAYDLLCGVRDFVDVLKLGWGTARLFSDIDLARKVELCRSLGIGVMPGGTLLEIAWARGVAEEFLGAAIDYGFTHIEVSCGTFDLGHDKAKLISRASGLGFNVFSEAGKKAAEWEASPQEWAAEAIRDLEAGADKIIMEGREAGTCGMYDGHGNLKPGIVEAILDVVPLQSAIFEAPQKKQQVHFIRTFGNGVNLGNVAVDDIVPLETLRLGLRGDTARRFCENPYIPGWYKERIDAISPAR